MLNTKLPVFEICKQTQWSDSFNLDQSRFSDDGLETCDLNTVSDFSQFRADCEADHGDTGGRPGGQHARTKLFSYVRNYSSIMTD